MNVSRAGRWLALAGSVTLLVAATMRLRPGDAPLSPAARQILLTPAVPSPGSPSTPDPLPPTLALIQGLKAQRLILLPLDGVSAPLEVDRGVQVWPLLPSPDGTRLLYGTAGAVMALDTGARRAAIVGELPEGGRLLGGQWSPAGERIAYVVQTATETLAFFAPADGSAPPVELMRVPAGLSLDVGWLPDGRPVALYLGLGPVGGLQTFYRLYDPVSGEFGVLPPGSLETVIQPWAPWRSPDGAQQVYPVSTWENARFRGACRTGPLGLADATWLPAYVLTRDGTRPLAFDVKGLFLDRPIWLRDGRVIFRAIADPVCARGESGVYIGRPGETPTRLLAVEPDDALDDVDRLLWSISFAVDPAQTQIAWSENNSAAQSAVVRVMPLAGGPAQTVFTTSPLSADSPPFTFRDQEMILYLVWLR